MKYGFLGMALLLLVGCIEVGSFGAYWDKGTKDLSLLGVWEGAVADGKPGQFTISEQNDVLIITDGDESRKDHVLSIGEHSKFRTLRIGVATFAMVLDGNSMKNGTLLKYALDEKGELVIYFPAEFQHNPFSIAYAGKELKNKSKTDENLNIGSSMFNVTTFSDSVFQHLTDMVNTPGAFTEYGRFHKK